MNNNIPRMLRKLTPRPAPPKLRDQVLDAIERELGRRKKPRWERMFERSVAATLLIAMGVACWRMRAEERWQSRVHGLRPISPAVAEIASAVASVTDEQTGRWIQGRLSAALPPKSADAAAQRDELQRIFGELHVLPSN